MSLESLSIAWWQWVTSLSWQVALLAGAIWLVCACFEQRLSARAMSTMWGLVWIKFFLPTDLSSPLSIGRLLGTRSVGSEPWELGALHSLSTSEVAWIQSLMLLWIAGILAVSGLGLWRYRRLRLALLTDAEPVNPIDYPRLAGIAKSLGTRIGLRHAPKILVSELAAGPAVIGFWRPTVLIPARLLRRASRAQINHVLLHELSHVARRDPWASLLCQATQAIFWFHPASWIMRKRLATLREIGCDHRVALCLKGTLSEYRSTLLELARPLVDTRNPIGLAFTRGPAPLLQRINSIGRWERHGLRSSRAERVGSTFVIAALLLCCVPLAPADPVPGPFFVPGLGDYQLPRIEDTRGCLQLRYTVMGRIAAEEAAQR